jgi:hypothetical protein
VAALIDRPALRRALAANGAELYRRLFTMDAFAGSIGGLYAMLAPGGGSVRGAMREVTDDR